jgi:hypothetical protein
MNKIDNRFKKSIIGLNFVSVADPGCLSRIRIFPSRIRVKKIPDPGSASKNISILTPKNFSRNFF